MNQHTEQYLQIIYEQHREQRKRAFKDFYYLPLFYLIPDEIAEKRGVADFPRNPIEVVTNQKWRDIYHSKYFQVNLLDMWGWMMWQCLGIRGGVDNYSKNDPFVIMVFSMPMWAWLLAEQGINTDLLAELSLNGADMPFLTMEQAAHNCDQIAKHFWNHPTLKMQEVWEIVKTHRDHKDYSSMPSHVKMDFHRQYYHTRAKTKIQAIVGAYGKNGEEEVIYAPYTPNEFVNVEFRIWFDVFLKQLNRKDRQIIILLEQGYTQEEIAVMLGYSNHSGISKRIKFIREKYTKFRHEK